VKKLTAAGLLTAAVAMASGGTGHADNTSEFLQQTEK
jgi:hypothetical protein